MANAVFALTKGSILDGGINFGSVTLKLDLIDTADDNPNTTTDDFYDDIAAGGTAATATLASVTTSTTGVLDAAVDRLVPPFSTRVCPRIDGFA